MKMLKISLCLALGCISLLFLLKKNNTEPNIQFNFPHQKEWERPISQRQLANINQILSQKFSYLGKGARSISFESEDHKYVLKFFKYRYHYPHWARYLPPIFPFQNYRKKKTNKVSLHTVLNGYHLAFKHDPVGTGLLYIHLNPTSGSHSHVNLINKEGKEYSISLDKTRFVLQLRVEELEDILDKHLKNRDILLAKQKIHQVFYLYLAHFQKGLYDLGIGIIRNNGFIGDKPIHFDVGKLTQTSEILNPLNQRKRLAAMAQKIEAWLQENYPQYVQEIMPEIYSHYNF